MRCVGFSFSCLYKFYRAVHTLDTRYAKGVGGAALANTAACRSLKLSLSTYTRARAALVAQKMSGKLCESLTISAYMPVSKFSPK